MAEIRPANVSFHGIGTARRELEHGEDRFWIGIDEFRRILDEVATWPDVRLSFDDGNSSDIEIALDEVSERGLTATFFVLAGRLGAAGSLSEKDVSELRRRGMGIGTHGMDHRSWRGMDEVTRHRELVEARQRISEVAGVRVDEAALPLGQYDGRILADLRGLGYAAVHTSDRRPTRREAWLQPRFSVRADHTPESLRSEALGASTVGRRAFVAAKGVIKRLR